MPASVARLIMQKAPIEGVMPRDLCFGLTNPSKSCLLCPSPEHDSLSSFDAPHALTFQGVRLLRSARWAGNAAICFKIGIHEREFLLLVIYSLAVSSVPKNVRESSIFSAQRKFSFVV